jgi:hypothetical protein
MKEDQHEEVADPNLAAFPNVASAIFGNLPLRKRPRHMPLDTKGLHGERGMSPIAPSKLLGQRGVRWDL